MFNGNKGDTSWCLFVDALHFGGYKWNFIENLLSNLMLIYILHLYEFNVLYIQQTNHIIFIK